MSSIAQTPPQPTSPSTKTLYVWQNLGKVIDRNRRPVDTNGDIWVLQDPTDNININWSLLILAPDIKDALRAFLAHNIEAYAPKTAHQVFKQLKYCFERLPSFASVWDIDYPKLEVLLTTLRKENKDWRFHYVRQWYLWCDAQGLTGFSGKVASQLSSIKVKVNPRGHRVMTRDVNDGPLTNDEHFLVRQAVKEGIGALLKRVIVMLLLELGARPIQIVALEEQDFKVMVGPNGVLFYSLDVPRAKQRTVGAPEKKRRRVSSTLGKLIEELIESNHRRYGNRGPEMPILCATRLSQKRLTEELKVKYELHVKVIAFNYHVQSYAKSAKLISPRTGQILNLTAMRLRYTFFTLLAEQGTSTVQLAELADHSNTSSIQVYVGSTGNVVDRLNAALGKDEHYSGIILRFRGDIVARAENESEGAIIFGSTPTLKNLGGIGVCGANFLCNLYPPLSCYICPKFQAWLDGPHEQLLLELETYVRGLIEKSANPSDRIPYQLAEVMLAVRQLLGRISQLGGSEVTGHE
jgi:integrase